MIERLVLSIVLLTAMVIPGSAQTAGQMIQTGAADEATYQKFSIDAWRQINEDLTYSSQTLDKYVNKNITREEALYSTVAVFLLSSQTYSDISSKTPPELYRDYHNYSLQSAMGLRLFLWNLAKYYETENSTYAVGAMENFNRTKNYKDMAQRERELLMF